MNSRHAFRLRTIALVATSAIGLAGASSRPASAASAMADAFATNVWSNADFLDEASRLALTRSANGRLKDFARRQAAEETAAANAVVAWKESNTAEGAAVVTGRSVAIDQGSPVSAPLRAAETITADMADGIDGMTSGRSVAIDRADEPTVTAPAHPTPKANAAANLAKLQGLRGRAFDAFYASAERDALLQLSTIYATYIQNGEDPGLRSLSVRELAKVDAMLADLRRF